VTRWIFLLPFLSAFLAATLATLVIALNRRAAVNRLLAAGLAIVSVYQVALGATMVASSTIGVLAFFRMALGAAALLSPLWLAFGLKFGEQNGGSLMARWRPVLVGLSVTVPAIWAALATGRGILSVRYVSGPMFAVNLDGWGKAFFVVFVIGLSLVLLHSENLYRHADRVTRWRIKFLIVGIFVAFGSQIVVSSYALLYGLLHPWHAPLSALTFLIAQALIAFSLVRHRLLQVDIFVSRYVVYRSLTLALVGAYLLSLGAIAEVFYWLSIPLDLTTGVIFGSLGAAALALILLSDDVRRRLQRYLHTHFYKHKYDFRVEWIEFTHRLAQTTAIPEIATQIAQRVLEVMWVRRVAVYTTASSTKRSQQMNLAYQVAYNNLPAHLDLPPAVAEQLRSMNKQHPQIASEDTTITIPPELTVFFRDCPVGTIVPIAALDALAGLLVVGPELSGKPFEIDDRDFLIAVAAQAGAMMVNSMLAQDAADGRGLQALARLSAFVTHDLKNAVGTLAMLAENAPHHMHEPAFQADAVRSLSEITAKMRKLLVALSTPARRPESSSQQFNLTNAVETWARDFAKRVPSRIRFETHFVGTRDVKANPEELHSVLDNLALNAIEAIAHEGVVRIETADESGYAVLRVIDSGLGMTSDFVRNRLFRPFQTTKSRGLGIGLFQCRHIIQSLGGELTAESQEGVGTQMTVRLPALQDSDQLAVGSEQQTEGHG
jgi:putative PEP-CTERM system histidine kinase